MSAQIFVVPHFQAFREWLEFSLVIHFFPKYLYISNNFPFICTLLCTSISIQSFYTFQALSSDLQAFIQAYLLLYKPSFKFSYYFLQSQRGQLLVKQCLLQLIAAY